MIIDGNDEVAFATGFVISRSYTLSDRRIESHEFLLTASRFEDLKI